MARRRATRSPCGFPSIDKLLGGGFRRGDLIVLGGDVGSGKSALALAFAIRASLHGTRVAFLTAEMTVERVLERIIAIEARTRIDDLRQGTLDDADARERRRRRAAAAGTSCRSSSVCRPGQCRLDGRRGPHGRAAPSRPRRRRFDCCVWRQGVRTDDEELATTFGELKAPGARSRRGDVGHGAASRPSRRDPIGARRSTISARWDRSNNTPTSCSDCSGRTCTSRRATSKARRSC